MSWTCYWLEPAGVQVLGLRRYEHTGAGDPDGWTCEAGWHEALRWTRRRVPAIYVDDGSGGHWAAAPEFARSDRRWPTHCAEGCGHKFSRQARKQTWSDVVYIRADGREEVRHPFGGPGGMPGAAPGAMWHAPWGAGREVSPTKPEDGILLTVRCPAPGRETTPNDWAVDHASSSGGFWTRTGDPPRPPDPVGDPVHLDRAARRAWLLPLVPDPRGPRGSAVRRPDGQDPSRS